MNNYIYMLRFTYELFDASGATKYTDNNIPKNV
jgi:hypothetical protein